MFYVLGFSSVVRAVAEGLVHQSLIGVKRQVVVALVDRRKIRKRRISIPRICFRRIGGIIVARRGT